MDSNGCRSWSLIKIISMRFVNDANGNFNHSWLFLPLAYWLSIGNSLFSVYIITSFKLNCHRLVTYNVLTIPRRSRYINNSLVYAQCYPIPTKLRSKSPDIIDVLEFSTRAICLYTVLDTQQTTGQQTISRTLFSILRHSLINQIESLAPKRIPIANHFGPVVSYFIAIIVFQPTVSI